MSDSMFPGFRVAASGMSAQRARLNVVSGNLANAQTTRTEEGGPYARRIPVFEAVDFDPEGEAGVQGVEVVEVTRDEREGPLVYDPSHPDADADGNVRLPNVSVVEEMVDMVTASRSFEANAQSFLVLRDMVQRAIDMGR